MSFNKSIIGQAVVFIVCLGLGYGITHHSAEEPGIANGPDTINPGPGPEPIPGPGPGPTPPDPEKGYTIHISGLASADRGRGGVIVEGHTYSSGSAIETTKKYTNRDAQAVDVPGYKASVRVDRHAINVSYESAEAKKDPDPEPKQPSISESEATSMINGKNYEKLRGASLSFDNFDPSIDGEKPGSLGMVHEKKQFGLWKSVTVTSLSTDSRGKVTHITMHINR